MDHHRFSANSPGTLRPIGTHGGWSFVPNPLPPAWDFPSALWPLLATVKHKLGELEGVCKSLVTLEPANLILRPLINREALDSSTIEGTYATPRDLLLFQLRDDNEPSLFAAEREVANYTRALETAITEALPLNMSTLCEIHRILLTGTRGEEKHPGMIRDKQVAIGKDYRFVPPPVSELPRLTDDLTDQMNSNLLVDPLIDAFLLHYQFETVHPFNDGNGRVGRALLALMIFRKCGFSKPWLYLSSYFEKHRKGYIERLFRVSTNGDWDSWVEFCLEATHSQAVATIDKCERVIRLQQEFEHRVATGRGSFRLKRILSRLFELQFLTIPDLTEFLDVKYPTAKSDVEKLAALGILAQLKDVKPNTFYSPDLFGICYDSLD